MLVVSHLDYQKEINQEVKLKLKHKIMSIVGKRIRYVHTEIKNGKDIIHPHKGIVLDKLIDSNHTSYLIQKDDGKIDITSPYYIKEILSDKRL